MKVGVNALFMIPGEVGGSETYLRRTLVAAAKNFPQHEFIVFTNTENTNVLARDLMAMGNVILVDMHVKAMSRIRRVRCEQRLLPRVIKGNGIDVLWNPGNTAPFRITCPQVTCIYDMQFMHFPEDFSQAGLFFTRFFTRSSLRRSHTVLTLSEFSRQEIAHFTDTPFEKMRVTLLAATEEFSKPLRGTVIAERTTALVRSSDPYILVVANTYPHKSVETAIRAFGLISNNIPHRLVVVGKPRLGEPAVQEAIEELADPGRVVRIHAVSKPDLIALYQGAALFVFPSKYEGFGLPVLEAMCAGVPVVTTREGSIPEVGGDAVTYTEAGDVGALSEAIRQLLSMDDDARRGMVEKGRLRAASFSWDATARTTIAACEEAVRDVGKD